MNEILKSEILTVVLEKSGSVSFEDFAGLFRQIHGYEFKLSNYGYSSLRSLLEDMKDLVELCMINGQQFIKIRSPTEYLVVFYNKNHPSSKSLNTSRFCNVPLPISGPSSGLVSTSCHTQPNSSEEDRTKVNSAICPKKKSEECSKSKCPLSAKSSDPAECHEINAQSSGFSSSHKHMKNKKTDESPKFETSPGPASIQSEKLTETEPAKGFGFSSSSGPPNCLTPGAKPKSSLIIGCASSSGSSTNSGPSTKPKCSSNTVASIKAKTESPATSTICAKTQHKSVTSSLVGTNVKSAKSKSKSKTSATKNKKDANTQKIPLLPTPQIPLKNSSYDVINQKQRMQQGIRPNLSYAEACTISMSQFNQNRQQSVRDNINCNIHPPGVIQSRAQPRSQLYVMSNSLIRENIEALLKQHANGMSIFQLQKTYLFKFRQPLIGKGLPSVKQLLLGMKDVVKMQGVGVQMHVYPVHAEHIPSNAADRHLEDSMYAKEHKTKGVVLTGPHVSSSLIKMDSTQHQTVSLPRCNDSSSSSGQNQLKLTGGQVKSSVGKAERKQQRLQDKQTMEKGKTNFTGFYAMHYKDTKMVEAPSHLGIPQELDKAEWPVLKSKLNIVKDIKQFDVASVQPHKAESKAKTVSKPNRNLLSQDNSCNANFVEIPGEKMFAVTPTENLLHSRIKETDHLTGFPSSQTHQHMKYSQAESSYSQTEQDMHRTITENGPEHNESQLSDLAQFILHSSGFSVFMGTNNVADIKEATDPIVDHSSSKDSSPVASGIDTRMLVGSALPVQTHEIVTDTYSKMMQQAMSLPKPHQISVLNANNITQNTEHLLSQPHQTVRDSDCVAMSDKTESPYTKSYHEIDDFQGRSSHEQVEYPFPQPQKNLNTEHKNVLSNSASPGPETQLKRTDSHFENALLQTGSSSLPSQDKVHYLQTTGVFGQTSPSSSIEHKVLNDQASFSIRQIVSPPLQQQVTNYPVANESKQVGAVLLHNIQPMENVLGQTGTSSFNFQETVSPSQTVTNFQQTAAAVTHSEQKVINSKTTNECSQTESVESQSQDDVLGLQTQNVIGQTVTQSSHAPTTSNVLGQVTSPVSHTDEKSHDCVTENTCVQKASLALQSSQIVPSTQILNIIGKTSSQLQQKQSPSSPQSNEIQHIYNSEQAKLTSPQIHQKAPQLQQQVTNYPLANESKHVGAVLSHTIQPMENVIGQTGSSSFNSQETDSPSQTMTDSQQTVAVFTQSEQEVINSKITNECSQTESVESQDHVLGLLTKNDIGQTITQSSHAPTTSNVLGQVTSPVSHTHEKSHDCVTENTCVQKASLGLPSSQIVPYAQLLNIIGKTPSQLQEKQSPASPQSNEIQHIYNLEQAKLTSPQIHQKAPQSYISTTSAQNRSPPITQPFSKWTVPKHCDHLVSPPGQTVPQNHPGNGSEQKQTSTWQTDRDHYCCIL